MLLFLVDLFLSVRGLLMVSIKMLIKANKYPRVEMGGGAPFPAQRVNNVINVFHLQNVLIYDAAFTDRRLSKTDKAGGLGRTRGAALVSGGPLEGG